MNSVTPIDYEYGSLKVLFNQKLNDSEKGIYIYLQDICGDGELYFNVEYNVEYSNGSSVNGNANTSISNVLNAYGFENYEKLSEYLINKYGNSTTSFNKIVKEMQNKGITLHVDESETHQGPNFICGWC